MTLETVPFPNEAHGLYWLQKVPFKKRNGITVIPNFFLWPTVYSNSIMRMEISIIIIVEIVLLGETMLIYWSTGQTDPILSKNKKLILQNFCQLAFF